MSLNAILRWLKPHEMVFFDLLEGSAENIYQATLHFDREIRTGDNSRWPELRRQMKEYEHTGDEFTHQIIDRLDKTFVTPIEREDILALAHALDDVVDLLDAICERIVLYRIGDIDPAVMEISSLASGGRPRADLPHPQPSQHVGHPGDPAPHPPRARPGEPGGLGLPCRALGTLHRPQGSHRAPEVEGTVRPHRGHATDRIELVAKVVGSTVMRNA